LEKPPPNPRPNVKGVVLVEFTIDDTGLPTHVSIARGIDKRTDAAVIRAIRGCRFSPFRCKDRPLPCRIIVPIRYPSGNLQFGH